MKRLIFIVLVCNTMIFGANMQNLYKAYEKGYEFKNNDVSADEKNIFERFMEKSFNFIF